jgi:hypothetical protein
MAGVGPGVRPLLIRLAGATCHKWAQEPPAKCVLSAGCWVDQSGRMSDTQQDSLVWVTYAGSRYHSDRSCSGLVSGQQGSGAYGYQTYQPVQVRREDALSLGRTRCQLCRYEPLRVDGADTGSRAASARRSWWYRTALGGVNMGQEPDKVKVKTHSGKHATRRAIRKMEKKGWEAEVVSMQRVLRSFSPIPGYDTTVVYRKKRR